MSGRQHLAMAFAAIVVLAVRPGARGQETGPVSVRATAFSPDGKHLAVGFGTREVAGGLLVWNVAEKTVVHVLDCQPGVSSFSFSPDGKRLAMAKYDQAPQLLQWPSLEVEAELVPARRGPVAFAPDGSILATGCEDRRLYCWDVTVRQDKQSLAGHEQGAYTIHFSPDGRRIVSAAREGVLVWDVATGAVQLTLKHGSYLTSSAQFSPDGRWILTGGWDGTTRIWDSETGTVRARLRGTGGVDRLAFSPQTRTLVVSGTGSIITLFGLSFTEPSEEVLSGIQDAIARLNDDSYPVREAASAQLVKVGFLAEAQLARAASESPSAEVRIRARRARQAITSEPLAQLDGHSARIRCLSLSPAGTLLASGGDDGTVRLWDITSRQQVATFVPAELARQSGGSRPE